MNQQRIDEIKARCDKATAGKWIYDERVGCIAVYHGEQANCIDEAEGRRLFYADGYKKLDDNGDFAQWETNPQDCNNADFIAHSREDVPVLLAEIERQQDIISALESDKINDEMNLENLSAEIDGLNVMEKQLKAEVERLTTENAEYVNRLQNEHAHCEKLAAYEDALATADCVMSPEEVKQMVQKLHTLTGLNDLADCTVDTIMAENKSLQSENAALKSERDVAVRALEMAAEYIVCFGNLDVNLCDEIPATLHLKYQPKNDGNYGNEPCEKCVQEYFSNKAKEDLQNGKNSE